MTAAQELLINTFVAASAIPCGEFRGNDKAVMVFLFLAGCRLVAIEAVHATLRMQAHFVFVDRGILCSCVTFRALSRSAHELGAGLVGFHLGPRAVDQERSEDQRKSNYHCQEDRSKGHRSSFRQEFKRPGANQRTVHIVVGIKAKGVTSPVSLESRQGKCISRRKNGSGVDQKPQPKKTCHYNDYDPLGGSSLCVGVAG